MEIEELEAKAQEAAIKFMKSGFYDINDKNAMYEYCIDALIFFVKNGFLLGYKEACKDYLKGNI